MCYKWRSNESFFFPTVMFQSSESGVRNNILDKMTYVQLLPWRVINSWFTHCDLPFLLRLRGFAELLIGIENKLCLRWAGNWGEWKNTTNVWKFRQILSENYILEFWHHTHGQVHWYVTIVTSTQSINVHIALCFLKNVIIFSDI